MRTNDLLRFASCCIKNNHCFSFRQMREDAATIVDMAKDLGLNEIIELVKTLPDSDTTIDHECACTQANLVYGKIIDVLIDIEIG